MDDCIFCKIVAGEIPAQIVYDDAAVLAFLDIKPNNPGHVIVIPKKHSTDFISTEGETLRTMISVMPKIAGAIMAGLHYSGFNLSTNNGVVAGQIVPHLHFHIIPRKEGDRHTHFAGKEYAEGEMALVAESIRKALVT